NILFAQPKRIGYEFLALGRILRRRPNLGAVALDVCRAVLRLEIDMGNETVGIIRLDRLGRLAQGTLHVAVVAQGMLAFFRAELLRLGGEAVPAVGGMRTRVPLDLELAARAEGRPGGVGDDGD